MNSSDTFFEPFFNFLELSQLELLSMAVQGSSCDRRRVDLSQIFQSIRSEERNATSRGKLSHYMTQDELTIINAELSKLLTPEQTKHAMRILRGFRADATANEKDTALVSLETRKIV